MLILTGISTTCRSCLEHAPTAPPRSQNVSCPRPRSSNAALRPRARAPRASAIACASNAQRRPTRYSAPRRTRRACPSLRLLGSKLGWRSMRSRGVRRDCSLRTSNRANGLVAVTAARAKGWAMIGACIARLRTSEWKSEQKVAGGFTSFRALFPNIFGVDPFSCHICASLKVTGCGARSLDLAGCIQGFRAGIRGAARGGLAEKTRKGVATATSEGGRRCILHVRWLPSWARAHESQCVIFHHRLLLTTRTLR